MVIAHSRQHAVIAFILVILPFFFRAVVSGGWTALPFGVERGQMLRRVSRSLNPAPSEDLLDFLQVLQRLRLRQVEEVFKADVLKRNFLDLINHGGDFGVVALSNELVSLRNTSKHGLDVHDAR